MNFDMNTCWSRAVELLQSNFQLLIVIAGMFVLLPTMALYLLVPEFAVIADPTTDPSVLEDKILEILGPLIAASLVSLVFQFGGQAAMIALMSDTRPTVGQALIKGFKTVPSLFAVLLGFSLLFMLLALIVTVPVSLLAGLLGAPGLAALAVIPMLIAMVWLLARMSLAMPVLVLGGTLNPVTAITQSFRLTKPKQWAIAGFWTIIFVVITIASLIFNGVAGVVAAIAGAGTAALAITGLANGVTGAIGGMVQCAVAAAMFTQLSGPSTEAIEETFE
ncbi:MAG: hypothetical protein AAF697_06455 [Pseudomonadota bacterium]